MRIAFSRYKPINVMLIAFSRYKPITRIFSWDKFKTIQYWSCSSATVVLSSDTHHILARKIFNVLFLQFTVLYKVLQCIINIYFSIKCIIYIQRHYILVHTLYKSILWCSLHGTVSWQEWHGIISHKLLAKHYFSEACGITIKHIFWQAGHNSNPNFCVDNNFAH